MSCVLQALGCLSIVFDLSTDAFVAASAFETRLSPQRPPEPLGGQPGSSSISASYSELPRRHRRDLRQQKLRASGGVPAEIALERLFRAADSNGDRMLSVDE